MKHMMRRTKVQTGGGFKTKHTHNPGAILSEKRRIKWKPSSYEKCSLNSERMKHVASYGHTAVFYIGYFLRMKGIAPLPQRQNFSYPEWIQF